MSVALLNPDPDDFRRAQDIFLRALELDPDQREAFVVRECGSNGALLEQIRKFLDADARARIERFLETPTHMVNPLAARKPYANPGDLIGKYKIVRVLGEGGMGVVYLAWDDGLGRHVAIKALSPAYTHDPNRRERFQREAYAAAQLSHPGIPKVHHFEEYDGDFFIGRDTSCWHHTRRSQRRVGHRDCCGDCNRACGGPRSRHRSPGPEA
jgi:hypothetical protein